MMKLTINNIKKAVIWSGFVKDSRDMDLQLVSIYHNAIGVNDMTIASKEYTPQKGHRIYFMPDCTVPRVKVRGYCDNYGVSMCKHSKDADVIFFGPESVRNLFAQTRNMDMIPMDTMKEFIRLAYSTGELSQIRALGKLAQGDADFILCSHSYSDMVAGEATLPWGRSVDGLIKVEDIQDCSYWEFKNDNCAEDLKTILHPNSLYVSQDKILRELNTAVMDNEMYHNAVEMFRSSDDENHLVAMEIMANCDYEKSAVYLLMLFKNFGKQINNRPTKSHVNFRSLMSFFEINNNYHKLTVDNVIHILRTKKLFTQSNLNILTPLVEESVIKISGTEMFESAGVKLKPEFQEEVVNDIEEDDISKAIDSFVPNMGEGNLHKA